MHNCAQSARNTVHRLCARRCVLSCARACINYRPHVPEPVGACNYINIERKWYGPHRSNKRMLLFPICRATFEVVTTNFDDASICLSASSCTGSQSVQIYGMQSVGCMSTHDGGPLATDESPQPNHGNHGTDGEPNQITCAYAQLRFTFRCMSTQIIVYRLPGAHPRHTYHYIFSKC